MGALETYNEFLRGKIAQMFNEAEAERYADESDKARPKVIRVNTLLSRPKELVSLLAQRGVQLRPLDFCSTAFVVEGSAVPIGATPEYLAGYYSIQGASSLLPVISLDVGPGMRVLDMCAAPGGKASFIGCLLRNSGGLFAVDISRERMTALRGNLLRQNIISVMICCDAQKVEVGKMDRILLDAPCSGTGIVSNDPSVKTGKSESDLRKLSALQKRLIWKAFESLKLNGALVYSTCSILVEENEEVIDYLCKKTKNVKILEGPPVGSPGFVNYRGKHFDKDMSKCRRIFPHIHNMDGFFIAKLTRTGI